jgi:hypothetical protein
MQKLIRVATGLGILAIAFLALLLLPDSRGVLTAGKMSGKTAGTPSAQAIIDRLSMGRILTSLPLRFEKNAGQADARVQYVARGGGYNVLLSGTQAFFVLDAPRNAVPTTRMLPLERLQEARRRAAQRVTLRMEIAAANQAAAAEPLELLETRSNYLIGNDPSQWHTRVPNYARVRYREVYPGVDLVYHGEQNQFEYDFVLAPGRDPAGIRLRFDGADSVHVNGSGDLVLRVGDRELRQQRPVAFQTVGSQRHEIAAGYRVRGSEVQFTVGPYDASRPLTIDPSLLSSTFFGGSGDDVAFAIFKDPLGVNYITGVTGSVNLPTTAGVFQPAKSGMEDAFVAKINSAGTAITFCTYLGGSDYDEGDAIAVDGGRNVYIAGLTASVNFPGTLGHAQPLFKGLPGSANAFIAKLNNTGATLTFATYLGGGGPDGINSIALDGANNIYATGFTLSGSLGSVPAFPTTAGVVQPTFQGTTGGNTGDAFATKLAANGNSFLYSTYLGGSRDDEGWGIELDAARNAYLTGETQSANFPTTAGVLQQTAPAKLPGRSYSCWLSELNTTASAIIFATYLGGNGNDHCFGLARSAAGNLYVTGSTTSNNLATSPGAFQPAYAGPSPGNFGDAFVGAMNPTGTGLVYFTYLGGSGEDAGAQIRVDNSEFAYVVGFTSSTDFPVTPGAAQSTLTGLQNAWVAKIRPGGTLIIHSSYLGWTGTDAAFAAAVANPPVAVAFTGSTTGNGFPTTAGVVQTAYGGGATDAFVANYDMRAPTADFTPSSLTFPPQTVGTMSAAMPITYKNIGNATLTINTYMTTGDFSQTHTCGATLGAGASCTINVVFKPTALGPRSGTLKVTDSAAGSPHILQLVGTGQ